MAAVESAKKALWALLRSYNAQRCAKLKVSTEKGKLKVILVENFDKHTNLAPLSKGPRKISPSQFRRKASRAADPAVKDRAAAFQTGQVAAVGGNLATSPVKDDISERMLLKKLLKNTFK